MFKKILSLSLATIMLLCLSACNKNDTSSETHSNLSTITSNTEATSEIEENRKVKIDSSAFDEGVVLNAESYTDEKINELFSKTKKTEVYQLTAKLNNTAMQPNGDVTVTFPIPEGYDQALHNVAVFYIDDNYKAELLNSQIKDNIVEAKLSHFSLYSVSIIEKSVIETVIAEITGKKDTATETNSSKVTSATSNKTTSKVNSTVQADNKAKFEAEAKAKAEAEAKKKAEDEAKAKAEAEAKAQAELTAKNPLKSLKYNVWYTYYYNGSADGNTVSVVRYRFFEEPSFTEIGEIGVEIQDETFKYTGPVSNPGEYDNLFYNGKYFTVVLDDVGGIGAGSIPINSTGLGDNDLRLELTIDGNLVVVKSSTPNIPGKKVGDKYYLVNPVKIS